MKRVENAGDALRELDSRALVHSDPFVLCGADVVGALPLAPALAAHRARKARDADAAATLVLRPCGAPGAGINALLGGAARGPRDELVVTLDAATSRVLAFSDEPRARACRVPRAALDARRFQAGATLRDDLLDVGVDVCSPEVLWRFSENFDYQRRRADYVVNEVRERS